MTLSVAPAHGGVGDTATGQLNSREMKGSMGTAKVAGRVVAGKGRAGGSSRVARLGSALDNVETRADEARGRGGRGVRASSGQRVCAMCCAGCKRDRMQISSFREMTTKLQPRSRVKGTPALVWNSRNQCFRWGCYGVVAGYERGERVSTAWSVTPSIRRHQACLVPRSKREPAGCTCSPMNFESM